MLTATVTKVLFADHRSSGDKLTATGAESLSWVCSTCLQGGHSLRRNPKGPGDLLSGIIQRLGIDLKIDLPGVGENVQEHVLTCAYTLAFKDDPK